VILSLFYGVGAVLIIVWNASVLATVLGDVIRQSLAKSYITLAIGSALLTYAAHGIPEILAYLIGALAGGLVSVATIRHHYTSKKFYYVLQDATWLVIISFALLLLAAIIESLILL
jgi:uncharacterized membrane protein SpoIIM required for sporulation